MNARPLILLSPYRPPTSYPVTLADGEAAAWLNAYAALWHPLVLKNAAGPAVAESSYDHDVPKPYAIYALPEGPTLFQPDDWQNRLREANAVSFTATANREETFHNLIQVLIVNGETITELTPEIVSYFTAIGFGYLTVETWYDAAEHEHLLDRDGFWSDVQAAVNSTELQEIRNHLKLAAEKLLRAREVVHSGTIRLLDFAVLDSAKLDAHWPASLDAGVPLNVVGSASQLAQLKNQFPERFSELMAKCPADLPAHVEFCIGSEIERDDAALPVESQIWNLVQARTNTKKITGQDVSVFARNTCAIHGHLPGWLLHTGYHSAIAKSFDGVVAPHQKSPAIHWPGSDGKALDTFAKEPLPASEAQTFFNFAYYLHQAAGQESQPAIAFRHRETTAASYRDLLTLEDLSNVVGEWTGIGQYLRDVGPGDYSGPAGPDDYAIDPLDDRVSKYNRLNPVSGFATHLRLRRRIDSCFALASLQRMLSAPAENEIEELTRLEQLENQLELAGPELNPADELNTHLESFESSISNRFAARIQSRSEPNRPGYLLLNPCAFTRRAALELEPFANPIPVDGPVKAAQFDADRTRLVVEVPPLGFAWIPKSANSVPAPKIKLKTAEGVFVRNEFFEAEFDPATGGIKAFRDLRTRSNRMAVIPVFNPGCKTRGTSLRITHAGTALGEIISEGELVSEVDEPLATFRIRARAWIGRPVLELKCGWNIVHKPTGYPWHSYYGLRFGTRDDRVTLFRGINGTSYQAGSGRVISPDFFEFRLGRERSFIFPGGLPFMSKHGSRTNDLVLIPQGETQTSFEMLLALDRDHPSQTSAGWVAPMHVIPTDSGPPPVGTSSWLGQIDMPSLMMTDLRPVTPHGEGMTRAIAARFLETAGYGGSAELKFARDPARAFQIDGMGETNHELTMNGDAIPLEYSGGELYRIKAEW